MHYGLLTSPKLGAERRRFYKSDLDDCPIVPFERLSRAQKRTIVDLSNRLLRQNTGVFTDIDEFFAGLYGLDNLDLEVIDDTLDVCLPYRESRERACRTPSAREHKTFRDRVEGLLRPFFKTVGQDAVVELWQPQDARLRQTMPFSVLLIGERGRNLPDAGDFLQESVVPLVTETGQTLIIQESEDGLLVAILNQYRYWTPSRARLLAAEILRNHMAPFGG